jgi:hypothetical protein
MEPVATIFLFGCLVTVIVGTGVVFAIFAFNAADSVEFAGKAAPDEVAAETSPGSGYPPIERL